MREDDESKRSSDTHRPAAVPEAGVLEVLATGTTPLPERRWRPCEQLSRDPRCKRRKLLRHVQPHLKIYRYEWASVRYCEPPADGLPTAVRSSQSTQHGV